MGHYASGCCQPKTGLMKDNYDIKHEKPAGHDRELADSQRAHSGHPGSRTRHGHNSSAHGKTFGEVPGAGPRYAERFMRAPKHMKSDEGSRGPRISGHSNESNFHVHDGISGIDSIADEFGKAAK